MTWWIVGGLLLAAGAVLPAGWTWHRSRMSAAHVQALSRYEELGHRVATVPATDPVAERALSLATERWNSAGAALADARTDDDYRIAERIADEGLAILRKRS